MYKTVEELIKSKVPFTKLAGTGFNHTKCPICNDYQDRMGIKFSHPIIIVKCFNCGYAAVHDQDKKRFSKKFKTFLACIADDEEIKSLETYEINEIGQAFQQQKVITLESITKINTSTPTVELPKNSVKLDGTNFKILQTYLDSRKMDCKNYSFYGSNEPEFRNRVIIPFYRNNKLIYWQARDVTGTSKRRYLNCTVSKLPVFFNYDKLTEWGTDPLYVTEGVFDAMDINGVSIIGSELSETKIQILSKAHRPLIFVIDIDKNGKHLLETILKYNIKCDITHLDKMDINKSNIARGKMFTFYSLNKNIKRTQQEKELFLSMLISKI